MATTLAEEHSWKHTQIASDMISLAICHIKSQVWFGIEGQHDERSLPSAFRSVDLVCRGSQRVETVQISFANSNCEKIAIRATRIMPALLIDEQLRVADNVDEQNVSYLEPQIG